MTLNSFSVYKLQAKLDQSRVIHSRRDRSGCWSSNRCVGQIELGVIEDIEDFSAKLDVSSLSNPEALEDRKVEIGQRGSTAKGSSRVAKSKRSRWRKALNVKVSLYCSLRR